MISSRYKPGDFRTIVVGRFERVGRSGTYCPPRVPGSREVGTWTLGQVEFHKESKQGGLKIDTNTFHKSKNDEW